MALFEQLERSGWFTAVELRTIYALAFDRITFAALAQIDRCSRQAVQARIYGNSKRQGGLIKKVLRFWRQSARGIEPGATCRTPSM